MIILKKFGPSLGVLTTTSAGTEVYPSGQVTDQLHLVLAVQVTLFVFGGFLFAVVALLLIHNYLEVKLNRK